MSHFKNDDERIDWMREKSGELVEGPHFLEGVKLSECVSWYRHAVDAMEAAPAWHKRPTCPGLWVCEPSKEVTQWIALELSQERIDAGAPFCSPRVYGPIPNPPEETTT